MTRKLSLIPIIFSLSIIFLLFTSSEVFAISYGYIFEAPAPGLAACFGCETELDTPAVCFNSQSVGVTSCPGAPCSDGQPWRKYEYLGCFVDAERRGRCNAHYDYLAPVCSIGDKYNSNNPPVMDSAAGSCDCSPGGPYKTCCSAGSTVGARSFADDPYDPLEADCGGNTEVRCGAPGEPACGIAACGGPPPTPTDVPPEPTSTPVPAEPTPTPTK